MNTAPKGRKYRDLFDRESRGLDTGGFANSEDFLRAVHTGLADPRLSKRTMVEGVPSAGGFAVPEEVAAQWLDEALESEIVRPRATVWPMSSNSRSVPGFDGADHTSSLFGGITGTWLGEGVEATEVDPKLRKITLTAHKLACFAKASNELLADGVSMDEMLSKAIVQAISWYLDTAFLTGSGVGRPKGVLNDSALIVVPKEVGQPADSLTYDNLCKMFARLHPACVSNSVWVLSNSTIPSLLRLSIPIGTAGSHIPVLQSSNGSYQLLTRPCVFSEKMNALGDQGDVLLADFSKYAIGMRRELALERSGAVYWKTDLTAYRCLLRADGQGMFDSAITPLHGDTLSWCVTLAERA